MQLSKHLTTINSCSSQSVPVARRLLSSTCSPWPLGYAAVSSRATHSSVQLCRATAPAVQPQQSKSSGSSKTGAKQAKSTSSLSPSSGRAGDWRQGFMEEAMEAGPSFVELSLKGKISAALQWRSVVVRPVTIKRIVMLQFSYFGERQNVVKNEEPRSHGAQERLHELLLEDLPWSAATLKTVTEVTSVQITKSGKEIVHKQPAASSAAAASGKASAGASTGSSSGDEDTVTSHSTTRSAAAAGGPGLISLSHDRKKGLPIPPDVPHPFLQRLGLQTSEGRVRADMSDKMTQVNEFLKLMGHTGVVERLRQSTSSSSSSSSSSTPVPQAVQPVRILDCGCGSAYLTLCTFHYLNNVLGIPASLEGVDTNAELMKKCNTHCQELGLSQEQASFTAAPISSYSPPQPPDVVIALHACDTATDDALALAYRQGAELILASPCCHKYMHRQLSGAKGLLPPLAPMMRSGILKQRTIDNLTDTMRAQILRILGYKVDIVEFCTTEHTPRNLLIRAVKVNSNSSGSSETSGDGRSSTLASANGAGSSDSDGEDGGKQKHEDAGATTTNSSSTAPGAKRASNSSTSMSRRQELVKEYLELKAFLGGAAPYLEALLRKDLEPALQLGEIHS